MYKQMLIPTWSSWEAVANFYHNLVITYQHPYEPMAAFVEQIAVSQYANGLHPVLSHTTLMIGQTTQIMLKREMLEVQFLPKTQRFQFDFWEDPYTLRRWTRECGPTEAFALLERLLKIKRWFLAAGPGTEAEPSIDSHA